MDRLRVVLAGAHSAVADQVRGHPRVEAVRECDDPAALRATALTWGGDLAIVQGACLRALDASTVEELRCAGLPTLAFVSQQAPGELVRVRRLGVLSQPVPHFGEGAGERIPTEALDAVLRAATSRWREVGLAALETVTSRRGRGRHGRGRVVAVWGPAGAPGRSVLAAALAGRASLGESALLVDADPYGGAQAAMAGRFDDTSGLLQAIRLADAGRLEAASFDRCVLPLAERLGLLSGLPDTSAWPRLRPAGLRAVLETARRQAAVTVVDCGFCLEEDEELSYDTAAPRRNAATLAALGAADRVIAVGVADPVGAARMRAALPALYDVLGAPVPVLLRAGTGEIPRRWAQQLEVELRATSAVQSVHRLPHDPAAVRAQLATGRALHVAAPTAALTRAVDDLAGRLLRV